MKNKKAVYFLLPAVILIWGAIFYKINQSTGDKTYQVAQSNPNPNEKGKYQMDTFSLIGDYDDPFLKKFKGSNEKVPAENRKPAKPIEVPKKDEKPIKWPSIAFGGIVKNKDTKQELVMLIVNGTSYLMRKKDEKANVQLLEITADSILVSFGDEKKYIRK